MAKTKKKKQKDLCNLFVQVPRSLRQDFRVACYRQDSTVKNAIMLLMQAAIEGRFIFNRGLKIAKKSKK